MSVINKMLRDLDARRVGASSAQSSESRRGVMRDTVSVKDVRRASFGQRLRGWRMRSLLANLLLGLAGATWWYLDDLGFTFDLIDRMARTAPVPASLPIRVATSEVQPTAPATVVESAPEPSPSPLPSPVVETRVRPVPGAVSAVDAGQMRARGVERPQATPSKPLASVVNSDQAVTKPSKPEPAPPPLDRPMPTERTSAGRGAPAIPAATPQAPTPMAQRQVAVAETLLQAQNLWNSGSREAAVELMRDAVAVAERSGSAGGATEGVLVLAPLVQELARMELAMGRVSQVLDMLTRLEPALSKQADIWAVRGNAAQRLGRHQDSVNAYLTALSLRPNQPRWMLAAAVSMAAQGGQTAAAAELAEKARAAGVVSPEVVAYLRQLGVPLSER